MSTIERLNAPNTSAAGRLDLGMLAMGNEEHPGPTRAVSSSALPAKRTLNLSDVPGRTAADNYVGIAQKSADGSTTTTEVRMQAVVKTDGNRVEVLQIIAVGPVIKRDGKLLNERAKTYVVRDDKGQPITDPALARPRVIKMLQNQGMTTVSAADRQRMDRSAQARSNVATTLRAVGATTVKAPGIDYATNPNQPNRFSGKSPAPQRVERGGFNVSWQTEAKGEKAGSPTFSAMIVPNAVFEAGMTKTGPAVSATVQPFTGFFPISGGDGANYRQTTHNQALARTTVHPAGFYPGDANATRWNQALRDFPAQVPEIRTSHYGHTSTIRTENWWQVYVNTPNLMTPLVGASVNARAIANRVELRDSIYTQTDTTAGRDNTQFVAAPYSWAQTHTKVGVSNAALATRDAYGKVGVQAEVGVYVYNTTVPLTSPFGGVDRNTLQIKDWHIVNGSITQDRKAFFQQFAQVEKPTGLFLLSESVIPEWGDRSAGVYALVPASGAGGTNAWQAEKSKAVFSANGQRYVSAADMAKLLNKAGKELPKYKEFRFITADTLTRLNSDRLVTLKHPKTGQLIQVFKASTWVNTSARVSVGGPGVFLPSDVAPGK